MGFVFPPFFFFFINMDHPVRVWVCPSLDFREVAGSREARYTFRTRRKS